MTDKYQNKYRIKSARLQNYDYTRAGLYYITICTNNRRHYFGEIANNKMQLSKIGVLADDFWHEIKNHSKNIELHQFVVMPNHIHGILEILYNGNGRGNGGMDGMDGMDNVETMHASSLPSPPVESLNPDKSKNQQMATISPKSGSISRIIGSYKSVVSKYAHQLGSEFDWQSRFHDHIIRNIIEYNRISNYIKNNPEKWKEDRFN